MLIRSLRSAGVLLGVGALYLLGLWKSSIPLTGDQKTYVSIALEMRSRAEWIIPHLFDRANFLKPPFQYWATLLGWKALGFNVLGTLVPSVLAMLAGASLVRALSPDRSWVRALFFSGTVSVMTYGTTAQMEIWIVLFYLMSWHCLIRDRWALAWIIAGIMAWIKGPLYPVLWAASVALYEILNHRRIRISLSRVGWMGLGAATGLLWYGLAARTHFREMMDVFLLRENVGKLSTSQGSPLGLWGEFLGTLFPMLPWLVMSFFTREFRSAFQMHKNFWISYGLIPALFFTFFPYRVNTYLFVLVPVAVWCMVAGPVRLGPRVHRTLMGITVGVGVALTLVLLRLFQGDWMSAPLMGGFGVAIGVWIYGHFRLRPETVGLGALLLVTAVRLFAAELGERDLEPLRKAHAVQPAEVGYALQGEDIWHEFGQVSVALETPVQLLRTEEERKSFLAGGGLLILNDSQLEWGAGLPCVRWSRLRRRLKFPLQELFLKGLSFQDPAIRREFILCRAPGS